MIHNPQTIKAAQNKTMRRDRPRHYQNVHCASKPICSYLRQRNCPFWCVAWFKCRSYHVGSMLTYVNIQETHHTSVLLLHLLLMLFCVGGSVKLSDIVTPEVCEMKNSFHLAQSGNLWKCILQLSLSQLLQNQSPLRTEPITN